MSQAQSLVITGHRDARTRRFGPLFDVGHLAPALRPAAQPFVEAARAVVDEVADGEELWMCLARLVEAKNWAVRGRVLMLGLDRAVPDGMQSAAAPPLQSPAQALGYDPAHLSDLADAEFEAEYARRRALVEATPGSGEPPVAAGSVVEPSVAAAMAEFERLTAERDRLIAEGADPASLAEPVVPAEETTRAGRPRRSGK